MDTQTPLRRKVISRRARMALVGFVVLMLCVVYAATVGEGTVAHFDHAAYADTIRYQKAGESYYEAHLHAFEDRDITLSEFRAVRQPAIFLLWRWIPLDALWPIWTMIVVGGTCLLLLWVTSAEAAVIPVAAYLLLAGRIPSDQVTEQWLLVELWALLPLAGSVLCWQRGRHGPAAALAAVAVLIRETTAGFLLVALVLAWRSGDRAARRSWTIASAVAASGYAAHALLAMRHLQERGNDAAILGTGDLPRTIWEMVAWMVPGPDVIGVIIVGLGLLRLVRHRHDLAPLLGLFALAGAGLFVARPYWGFLFIPFGILLCGELLSRLPERSAMPGKTLTDPSRITGADDAGAPRDPR